MIFPIRLQKSRAHKRISPNGLKVQYVGRGKGKNAELLGNPFKVGERPPDEYFELYDALIDNRFDKNNPKLPTRAHLDWIDFHKTNFRIQNIEKCIELYDEYLELLSFFDKEKYSTIMELCKGKNLECWCKLGEPCHADILLRRCKEFFKE